jgi:UDP-2,4-diacetamido-2,4,6-trideoxy-beta-L-altropyranose hydrolase
MAMNMPSLKARLESLGIDVIEISAGMGSLDDVAQTVQIAKDLSASWIVVDGYHFSAKYQQTIKNSGAHLLLIDDQSSSDHYYADIVLNQNLHADESKYSSREPYTSLLLGTRYVLLREEFSKWKGWKREIPEVAQNLLVTLGGSDIGNITEKVVRAIGQIKFDKLEVVIVGPNNSYYEELECLVQKSKAKIQLRKNVTDMSELMAWADVAVSAGGTTAWELAFMGLPMLTIALADNQSPVVEELSRVGAAVNLGWHQNISLDEVAEAISKLLRDASVRGEMSRRAQTLVDGMGADRVIAQIEKVSSQ